MQMCESPISTPLKGQHSRLPRRPTKDSLLQSVHFLLGGETQLETSLLLSCLYFLLGHLGAVEALVKNGISMVVEVVEQLEKEGKALKRESLANGETLSLTIEVGWRRRAAQRRGEPIARPWQREVG